MKILMISSYLPYPLHSGGHVRLYNLIKELSGKHEITLVCEKRLHQTQADIKEVEKICKKVVTVTRRKQWSLENILKSSVSSDSFLVTGHTHFEMQKKIREELATSVFDLIHVETFYVMQNLIKSPQPPLRKGGVPQDGGFLSRVDLPIVLVEHNIEYMVYKKFVDRVPVPLRSLLALDIAKIKKNEEDSWAQATKLVAVTDEDKNVMEEEGYHPTIVSNGVDIDQFRFKDVQKEFVKREKKFLFMGDFKWIQNRDSLEFIIKEIFPKIKQSVILERSGSGAIESQSRSYQPLRGFQDDKIKLWVVGRHIPDSIRRLTNDPDIVFDEESSAKSTPEIFREASLLLCPIRVGGGSSYKILESMACGTPVVTMPMSASAINAKDGEHLMVGQTAEELAEKTIRLLQDNKMYERISAKGRELIEEKYSWREIGRELEKVYENVCKK